MTKFKFQMKPQSQNPSFDFGIHLIFGFWNLTFSCLLCLGFCFLFPCYVQGGQTLSLDQVISKVQEVYDRTEDIQADFDQETTLKSWGQTQVAQGKVSFKKNGRMCWEYRAPMAQKIVSDGTRVWVYIPQDRQVTVYEVGQFLQSEIASRMVLGKGSLKREFDVALEESPAGERRCYRLRLKPLKPQAGIGQIFLSVDMNSFQVFQTEMIDVLGNSNRIRLSHISVNTRLPDSMFTFIVPDGVQVVTPSQSPLPQ